MPADGGDRKGVMGRMETTDIVIHKGEKEERYQLFVEDYVMSYLKNYRSGEDDLYFYGKRERGNRKYYIYGAGRQKEISYFSSYELLDDIACRYVMDMPVFSVKEKTRTYELAGYDIFYQNNDAMQNYMIEQRRRAEMAERERDKQEKYHFHPVRGKEGWNTLQGRRKGEEWNTHTSQGWEKEEGYIEGGELLGKQAHIRNKNRDADRPKKQKNGFMAVQLSAIFVILAAIVINSTNSFSKLSDLNQAAVEVFFAMENQEAAEQKNASRQGEDKDDSRMISEGEPGTDEGGRASGEAALSGQNNDATDGAGGIVLRLEDLDEKFEEENQIAKQETEEERKQEAGEESPGEEDERNPEEKEGNGDRQEAPAADRINETEKAGETDKVDSETKADMASEQAFVRNFAEYYRIEKGDTLNKISVKIYGDTSKVKDICELNKIADPDNIKYGQKILLP